MKDPTGELLTAFKTALASITYNGYAWHVYKEEPPRGQRNYIYLSDLILNSDSDKDHYIFNGILGIQISAIKNKDCKSIVNDLGNSILVALTRVSLSMTNFDMVVLTYPNSVEITEETTDSNFIKRLSLTFSTQQK